MKKKQITPNKVAVITGINGQTGPYLARHLIENNYKVFGMMRQSTQGNLNFVREFGLDKNFEIVYGDLTDDFSLSRIITKIQPHEFYNLGALTHPGLSFDQPELTLNVTGLSVLRILEQIRCNSPFTKLCQVSSADIFAGCKTFPQNEETPTSPVSPYGVAKTLAFNLVNTYVSSYNLWAANLICYNHDSPRRSPLFVTRKITKYVSEYAKNKDLLPLELGNLNSSRDWGDVISFVKGMHAALQQEKPDNYLLATGKLHTIKELCKEAFKCIGVEIAFFGEGTEEYAIDKSTGNKVIIVNKKFFRPSEPVALIGDYTKAKEKLKWSPTMNFENIISWMVNYDLGQSHVYPKN